MTDILKDLLEMRDEEYALFCRKIIPDTDPQKVLGIRTPQLRAYAKKIKGTKEAEAFLNTLPHEYFEEDQLHAFLIAGNRDFDTCIQQIESFLPYVSSWATCDQMNSTALKKDPVRLLECAYRWMASEHTYTVRFGILTLMRYFLDERYDPAYPEKVAELRSEEYYVRMMAAWYFATALAKQYDSVVPYLEENRLDTWTHNKTIRKAVESYRISDEQKAYLKTLKRK
ncbi:MAG: DNA alkylation repair protein [Solobacterium sp.]|nr:DNA alkylation repair protein [Solobacterium sp.]